MLAFICSNTIMVDALSNCVGKTPSHVEIAILPMMNDHQDNDNDDNNKSRERGITTLLAQPWQVGVKIIRNVTATSPVLTGLRNHYLVHTFNHE